MFKQTNGGFKVNYTSTYNKPIALYKNNNINGTPTKMPIITPTYGINPIKPITNAKNTAIK